MKITELFLFEKCPLHCIDCPLNRNKCDFKQHKTLISKSKFINISGGDPLSSPELTQTIEFYIKQNKIINLFSPGYFLPSKTDVLQDINLFLYMHSINPAEHDFAVGKNGAYKALLENIDILIKANIKPIILFNVNKLNTGDLLELKEYINKKELFLWLEITPSHNQNFLSSDEINQIKYFAKGFYCISNISVIPNHDRCLHLPNLDNFYSNLKFQYFCYKKLHSSNSDHPIYRSDLIKSFL